jgi:hypothetical protein
MTSLRHLNISSCDAIDRATAEDIGSGELGPRLGELHAGSVQDLDRVLGMVESRQTAASAQHNVSCLKNVSFRGLKFISASSQEHYQKRIDELRRSGVDIVVDWS